MLLNRDSQVFFNKLFPQKNAFNVFNFSFERLLQLWLQAKHTQARSLAAQDDFYRLFVY